jgi:peroxiredoxin family protein
VETDPRRRVAIFLHAADYDRLHQGASIAATATALGRDVQLFFFWWALDALARGALATPSFADVAGEAGVRAAEAFEEGAPTAAELLASAREDGRCWTYALGVGALVGLRIEAVELLGIRWLAGSISRSRRVPDRYYL